MRKKRSFICLALINLVLVLGLSGCSAISKEEAPRANLLKPDFICKDLQTIPVYDDHDEDKYALQEKYHLKPLHNLQVGQDSLELSPMQQFPDAKISRQALDTFANKCYKEMAGEIVSHEKNPDQNNLDKLKQISGQINNDTPAIYNNENISAPLHDYYLLRDLVLAQQEYPVLRKLAKQFHKITTEELKNPEAPKTKALRTFLARAKGLERYEWGEGFYYALRDYDWYWLDQGQQKDYPYAYAHDSK